jgi:hypothetical protein
MPSSSSSSRLVLPRGHNNYKNNDMASSPSLVWLLLALASSICFLCTTVVSAQEEEEDTTTDNVCIASSATINADFVALNGGTPIPTQGSCCMFDVCGLACAQDVPSPSKGTCDYLFLVDKK